MPEQNDRGGILAGISNAMVRIHKENFGKGPTKARTVYTEDVVLCRLEEVFTKAEQTMVRRGRRTQVRDMRRAFQEDFAEEFRGAVEQYTGRKVVAFMSEVDPETEMAVEVFFLERDQQPAEDPSAEEPREA